jgi:hypothetical protein
MVDFLQNESILFKHLAKQGKSDGEVVVTDIRLIFVGKDSKDGKSLTWANIANIDYTPATDERTAIRIKTVFEGDKIIIIQLVAADKNARIAEYLRMKEIISQLRKTHATPKESSKPQQPVDEALKLDQMKKQLLEADKSLANEYKEFVTGRILSEDDFWQSHQELLNTTQTNHMFRSRKGTKNFVLSDAMVQDEDGRVAINLTPELKEIILTKYPVVRKAFENEVPLQLTEKEFWEKFFKAEYFNKTEEGHREPITEDPFFAKYVPEMRKTDSKTDLLKVSKLKKRFSVPINTSIDLTANYGDYYRKDESEPQDESLGRHEGIIQRWNDDSTFVLNAANVGLLAAASSSSTTTNNVDSSYLEGNDGFSELRIHSPKKYQKMDLSKLLSEEQQKNSLNAEAAAGDAQQQQQSAFRKSDKLPNTTVTGKRKLEFTAEDFQLKPLQSYLPNAQRSEKIYRNEITRISKLENIRIHNLKEHSSDDDHSSLVPPDIKQVRLLFIFCKQFSEIVFSMRFRSCWSDFMR